MRISDWSSDVCSSDRAARALRRPGRAFAAPDAAGGAARNRADDDLRLAAEPESGRVRGYRQPAAGRRDTKSVVEGKSGSVSVELRRRRIIIKTTNKEK